MNYNLNDPNVISKLQLAPTSYTINNDHKRKVFLYETITYYPDEKFKYHPEYKEYIIGNYGTVIDTKTGYKKFHSNSLGRNEVGIGYARVKLRGGKNKLVHYLVAETYKPNPNPSKYTQINHKNCIKTDNSLNNIEWCTQSENIREAYRNGLMGKNRTGFHINI